MNGLRDLLSQWQVLLLGWTLVHFLWQGALVALILSMVLRAMKQRSAEARYAVACAAMLALLLCPVVTLTTFAPAFVRRVTASGGGAVPASLFGFLIQSVGRLLESPAANQLLRALVGAWGIGVLFLLARLLFGWVRVQQIRRAAVPVSCMPIRGRMSVMALRIGITKPVQLMESALAQGPAVVGFLRPMILLPTAAITGLWPVQIEAILAHELAHIRRHDYLANLLQSFVETLLFYHPAVWWVSARIREERENCCDDLAVKACGDRAFYAGCLADLDDLRPLPMELAMGAAGGSLLSRIRRILRVPNHETRTAAPAAAALAMLMSSALVLAGFARMQGADARKPAPATVASVSEPPVSSQRIELPQHTTFVESEPVESPAPSSPAVAPAIPFPEMTLSSVWSAGAWLEKQWPSLPVRQNPSEGVQQAGHEIRVPQKGDFDQPSDFPDVAPMSEIVHSNGFILPDAAEAFGGTSMTPDFPADTPQMPPSVPFGGSLSAVSPLNTLVGAPLNTVTGGPLNTVTGGPLTTARGPLTTVIGGPLMTVRGGPIMVTTGNPIVTRGPNYPQLVPSRGPSMTVQVRRSR